MVCLANCFRCLGSGGPDTRLGLLYSNASLLFLQGTGFSIAPRMAKQKRSLRKQRLDLIASVCRGEIYKRPSSAFMLLFFVPSLLKLQFHIKLKTCNGSFGFGIDCQSINQYLFQDCFTNMLLMTYIFIVDHSERSKGRHRLACFHA